MAASLELKKIVMVIGESGVGKSTIVNMLYNGDSTEDCCRTPCQTGSTAASVTKSSALQVNMQSRWCFVDTVGVGDPEMSEQQLAGAIRSLIRYSTRGVDCVTLVMKMERVPAASRANLALLSALFYQSDLKTSGVLVLTHWDGDLGSEAEDLKRWVGSDREMLGVIHSFSKVILTNNSLQRRSAYPESRRKCLLELTECIERQEQRIHARPVTVTEVLMDLVAAFGRRLWKRVTDVKDLFTADGAALPTYCGECSVCMEQIDLVNVYKLPCQHTFHRNCLEGQSSCPVCRRSFAPSECWWFPL
mmetsp:Transcript_98465/g.317458  ORF Transcript_98465/g.317458 Transcript_98465/m.317458 type:complete len:304 (+) Transcript_98465:83-994(+)